MPDVGEPGFPRSNPPGRGYGFLKRKVRGMLVGRKSSKNQHVQILQQSVRSFGDPADVGAISESPDPKAKHLSVAVFERHGLPALRADFEGAFDRPQHQIRPEDFLLRRRRAEKGVVKTALQRSLRLGVRPDIQAFAADGIKATQVVQPHHVIGMAMREDDGVDSIDPVGDALQTQFRAGIDKDDRILIRNDDGRPGTLVVRVAAGTDRTVAPDHRNAGAGACAKKNKFDVRHR